MQSGSVDFGGCGTTSYSVALNSTKKCLRKRSLAIIGTLHINKKQDLDARARAMGASAFINVPRSALLIAPDPDDHQRRVMVQTKPQLVPGTVERAVGFALMPAGGGRKSQPIVEWNAALHNADPEALLAKPRRESKEQRGSELLRTWLRDSRATIAEITQ